MMTNVRVEMTHYEIAKQYVTMVLFNDEEGVSSSLNWYFTSQRKAEKQAGILRLACNELTAAQARRAEVAANPYWPESELATIDAAIARIEAKIASL